MKILSRDTLPLGGFAGLTEHRVITDSRVFGHYKHPNASEGLGSLVYLADARFNPHGETTMHPHKEIDVISVMIEGQVVHEGSLEHGKSLLAGDVQVQRAGGEGFAHNEINPDNHKNRMIQLWVLPETAGEPAGYRYYSPQQGITRIYGGTEEATFNSQTSIDIVKLAEGESIQLEGESLSYITSGQGQSLSNAANETIKDGDLIHGIDLSIQADTDTSLIVTRYLR